MLRVNERLTIDERELSFRTSTSSGPGGQHVNRTETRVEVIFDVEGSPSLTSWQRRRIQEKLASRIARDGTLAVACDTHRSQGRNRDEVVERLVRLLQEALYVPPPRRATRPSRAAKRRRLDAKKQRGNVKKLRGRVDRD